MFQKMIFLLIRFLKNAYERMDLAYQKTYADARNAWKDAIWARVDQAGSDPHGNGASGKPNCRTGRGSYRKE